MSWLIGAPPAPPAAHEAGEFCLDTLLKYHCYGSSNGNTSQSPPRMFYTIWIQYSYWWIMLFFVLFFLNDIIHIIPCFIIASHSDDRNAWRFALMTRSFFSSSRGKISQIWIDSNSSFSFLLYLLVMTNIANWNMAHLQIMFPATNIHW